MSAQTRYRTLVHNISRVYSSPDAGRTELLQTGIDEIVGVMAPATASQWRTVKADTERLLRVWSAKEGDSDVAHVVADQIVGLLEELSFAPAADRIAHVNPYPSLVVEEFTPVARVQPPAPAVVSVTKAEEVDVADVEENSDDEEIASAPAADESEAEEEDDSDNASAPASVVAAIVEEEVVEPADEEEESEAEEEEVIEPADEEAESEAEEEEVIEPADEEEEEEEVGMEVEQVMIRGRTYWKDTNTNKLYAVVRGEDGEDDVGDEVGVLENGKPHFLAK